MTANPRNNMLHETWPQVLFVLSMLKNDWCASVSKQLQICNTIAHLIFFFTLLCWSNQLTNVKQASAFALSSKKQHIPSYLSKTKQM